MESTIGLSLNLKRSLRDAIWSLILAKSDIKLEPLEVVKILENCTYSLLEPTRDQSRYTKSYDMELVTILGTVYADGTSTI